MVATFDAADVADDLGPSQNAAEGLAASLAVPIAQEIWTVQSFVAAIVSRGHKRRRYLQIGSTDVISCNGVARTEPRGDDDVA